MTGRKWRSANDVFADPETARTEPAPLPEPKLLSQGTYALYETPQGGLHIAYRVGDSAETRHLQVPPWIVRNGTRMAGMDGMSLSDITEQLNQAATTDPAAAEQDHPEAVAS